MEKSYNAQYDPLIAKVVEETLGERPKGLRPIPTYLDTIVCEVELRKRVVIFKGSDPAGRDVDGIGLEAWASEKVREAGVPTPTIVAVDTSRKQLPMSYFIMEKAAGQPLSTLPLEARRPYTVKVGGLLRQMHTIALEGFGWLDETVYKDNGQIRGQSESWREALLEDIPRSLAFFRQNGALTPELLEIAERAVEKAEPLLRGVHKGSLLHGDLGSLHVWIDPTQETITSIVDFGDRCAGDPLWDIIRYEWDLMADLWKGYAPETSLKNRFDADYYLYAVLQALPWAHKLYARGAHQTVDWLKIALERVRPYVKE